MAAILDPQFGKHSRLGDAAPPITSWKGLGALCSAVGRIRGRGRAKRRASGARRRADGHGGGGDSFAPEFLSAALDALHALQAVPRAAASFHVRGVAEGGMAGTLLTRKRTKGEGWRCWLEKFWLVGEFVMTVCIQSYGNRAHEMPYAFVLFRWFCSCRPRR